MLGLGLVAQLGHEAEQGQLARAGQRRQRTQRRLGRRRVGVVAVHDQDGAVGDVVHLHPQRRPGRGRRARPPRSRTGRRTTGRRRRRRGRSGPAGRRAAPDGRRPRPRASTAGTAGAARRRAHVVGPHLGVALHRVAQHRRRAAGGHARPHAGRRNSGRRRPTGGSAPTSSLLARATPSRSPKYSTCAMATLVTMPTSGRATRARRAMCPTPRAPISRTTQRASSGALSRVSGQAELVVEGPLARRHHERRRQAARQEVLGRRLADRTRDADHAAVHPVARELPELHERGRGVVDRRSPSRRPVPRAVR